MENEINIPVVGPEPEESRLKKLVKQFSKFFIIGMINTLVDILILNAETLLTGLKTGYPYAVQKGFSFMVAVTMSYFMNKRWAFQDAEKENQGKKFSQFVLISLVGMGINMTAATLTVTYIQPMIKIGFLTPQLWVTVGALCGSVAGLLWNFVGYKFIVFKK